MIINYIKQEPKLAYIDFHLDYFKNSAKKYSKFVHFFYIKFSFLFQVLYFVILLSIIISRIFII